MDPHGSADAERQVLIAIAAAVITVVGVVFSITILALTLASQQFGPRMMRNFVRDIGNQVTLGVFVGTFVFSVLALVTINSVSTTFVPHLSTSVAEALLLVDLGVLIYFIHHIAKSIQLPEVIAGIADDLLRSIDAEFPDEVGPRESGGAAARREVRAGTAHAHGGGRRGGPFTGQRLHPVRRLRPADRHRHADRLGDPPGAPPGPLPGHRAPLAFVWPRGAAPEVALALSKAHVTGPHRTLVQDPVFAIDQLVEIAIRALSSAVNDTFTALTCIDWLSAGLGRVSGRVLDEGVYRDAAGNVRLIEFDPSYARMVNRAFDKIRQAASAMPAVLIRLIDSIGSIMLDTTAAEQRTCSGARPTWCCGSPRRRSPNPMTWKRSGSATSAFPARKPSPSSPIPGRRSICPDRSG